MKYSTIMIVKDKGRLLIVLTILLATILPEFVAGQVSINSPYTRYGPGNLHENGLDPRTTAMGGIHYGLQRNDLINTANPASYIAFDSVSFIFDAGLFGIATNLRTDELSDQGSYLSLSHLLFGFPVTHWWKSSFGIMPFSYVGYDIYNYDELEGGTKIVYNYKGSGGFNQLYWGNAFRIGNKLSAGFNLKYMFGNISRVRGVGFPDSLEIKNTRVNSNIRPNDIYGEIGIQYKEKLPKNHYIVAGATFAPQVEIHSKATYMASTYFGLINTASLYYDTIISILDSAGSWTLPTRIGTGVTAGKEGQWLAGVDFLWQNWKNYKYFGETDSLLNRWTIAAGGEYIPDPRSKSYLQRMSYRLGFHYGKTPINLKGHHIDEIGISFGLGLPIKKSKSTINLSGSFGRKGTIQDGLIQENFFRFTVGVNVFENWFFKSKYY